LLEERLAGRLLERAPDADRPRDELAVAQLISVLEPQDAREAAGRRALVARLGRLHQRHLRAGAREALTADQAAGAAPYDEKLHRPIGSSGCAADGRARPCP